MNENTELAQSVKESLADSFRCPKCGRGFSNANGLRMHDARVHLRTIIARGEGDYTKEERHQRNLAYRRKQREANIARGLTSSGKPRKTSGTKRGGQKWTPEQHAKFSRTMRRKRLRKDWGIPKKTYRQESYKSNTPEYKNRKYKEQRDRYYKEGLNARGQPFRLSKGGVSNIQKAQRDRRAREALKKGKRIQYIYPLPEEPAEQPVATKDVRDYVRSQLMHFCPKCGHDLHQWEVKTNREETK